MTDVDPIRTAEAVSRLHETGGSALLVSWLMVLGDREAYAAQVRAAVAGESIAVVVLREALFENVNAVMVDTVRLLESNRDICLAAWGEHTARVSVLILARAPLQVPQISSPVLLPDWVPCADGQRIVAFIRDLTFAVDAPLSSSELAASEISERLYDLEQTLTERLTQVALSHAGDAAAFWARIIRGPEEDLDSFLARAVDAHRRVAAPMSFRPSVRQGRSLVSRIWQLSTAANSDVVHAARDLAQSLRLSDDVTAPPDSIMAVIRRPTGNLSTSGQKLAYGLLVTTGAACQVVTSAAHADNYPRYPTSLLSSLSRDLRRSLAEFEALLGALPPL